MFEKVLNMCLDEKFIADSVAMDLPEAFECIPLGLVIAKFAPLVLIRKPLLSFIRILHVGNIK